MSVNKTAIVTGGQQGIGAGLVEGFLQAGYNVVGTSLTATASLSASSRLVLVDGDITKRGTAEKTVEAGVIRFGVVGLLVNNARIFHAKPFTHFTADDFDALASVNLVGFLHITQLAVKQMLRQKSGNVVTITGALADSPIAGVNASVSMITRGELNTVTRQLAVEYAKEGIRFNAVAPGLWTLRQTRIIRRILLPSSQWERWPRVGSGRGGTLFGPRATRYGRSAPCRRRSACGSLAAMNDSKEASHVAGFEFRR